MSEMYLNLGANPEDGGLANCWIDPGHKDYEKMKKASGGRTVWKDHAWSPNHFFSMSNNC